VGGFSGSDTTTASVDILNVLLAIPFSVSVKFNDWFSAGVNFNYVYQPFANTNIKKTYDSFDNPERTSSFNLKQEQRGHGWAYEVGVLARVLPSLTVGFMVRPPYDVRLNGDVKFSLSGQMGVGDLILNDGQFALDVPEFLDELESSVASVVHQPLRMVLGFGYTPTPQWKVAFDIHRTKWSRYAVEETFGDPLFNIFMSAKPLIQFWDLNDTIWYKLGFEYTGFANTAMRFGLFYDPSPVKEDWIGLGVPRTPSNFGGTFGVGYRDVTIGMISDTAKLDVDLAFLWGGTIGRTNPDTGVTVDGGFFDGKAGSITVSITTTYKY
jgi:long-subunit fatty acid transport protein